VSVYVLDLEASVAQAPEVQGVQYIACDVTSSDDVVRAVQVAQSGNQPLRIVINCAGVGPSARILSRSGVHDLGLFATVIRINLCGTFNVMATAAASIAETPADENGQRGVIINTASIAAFEGQIGQAAYAASKGGIAALTLPAARDLSQYGIRVCTIAPGIIDTPMLATVSPEFRKTLAASVPFPQRLGQAVDYAQLALMIIEHDYLNGETIRMDGALRMSPR
jgi:NAD(P)-dependent dehydrogenase (short-subunit alcohol dehydrogenase family)